MSERGGIKCQPTTNLNQVSRSLTLGLWQIPIPPPLETLLPKLGTSREWLAIHLQLSEHARRTRGYPHWNDVRHRPVPEGATREQWWLALKMARQMQELPLQDAHGQPFRFCQPPELLEVLHRIDMKGGGRVGGLEAVITETTTTT